MESRTLLTGTLTPLVNSTPDGSGTMMLETNGDVIMVTGGDNTSKVYEQLTPDSSGNYVDARWTQLASSSVQRLFYGSTVLQNGNIMIQGGEYSGPDNVNNDNPTGEIYNPSLNTWTPVAPFPEDNFGDDDLITLANGNILAGYLLGPQTFLYNPSSNTWTQTGTKLYDDQSDEEAFVKLPDGSLLDYDIFSSINDNKGEAQRYLPSTGTWVSAGTVPDQLSSAASGYELGGGLLLPDGRVFWIGGNGNTAYYTPSTNSWTAGPAVPNSLVQDDAATSLLPNGKILFSADTVGYNGPTHFFEYDPVAETYTDISSEFPSGYLDGPAFVDRTLSLPNGQVLINNGGNDLLLYTPDSPAISANVPRIQSVSENTNGSFTLTGTTIDGNSDGSVYGDDAEMATDYPIVSFTSSSGKVSYATTYGFNNAVEQGSTPLTTQFTLPVGLASGTYAVRVIANGAASAPFTLAVPTKTNDPAPTFIATASASPNPTFTSTANLSALGSDTAGESTLTYTWTTTASPAGVQTPTFASNGTNASKVDKVSFYAVGSYTFQVTATNLAGLSTSSSVTVNVDPALTTLALSPTLVQLGANQAEQFKVASGLDQFGNQITASSLTWAVTSGGGSVTSSGLYTAPATGTYATVTVSSGKISASASVYVLPSPWQQADVGSPNLTGAAAGSPTGTYQLLSGGTNISSLSDQFQYAYLSMTGNSTIEARVDSVQNTSPTAEAGIMFRNTLDPDSMNATIAITPSNGLVFTYRNATGGTTVTLSAPRVTAPEYVKLTRVNNTFTGSYSANGTTWTQVGSPVTIAMGTTVDAGLASTSGNAAKSNVSTLDNVLADSTPIVVTGASASPTPVTTTKTTLSVLGGDSAGESALTYTWAATSLPAGAMAPTFATNGTNASKSDVATFTKSGTYTFTVTLANALGYTATSSVSVTVVPTQTSVQLTPLSASVPEGTTQQFTAQVLDQFGLKLAKQAQFTYSMVAGGAGGKISSTGLYTAPNRTGVDLINVTGAGTAAVAKVTVTAGAMAPTIVRSGSTPVASVGPVSAGWGSDSAPLVTAADGLRLLPVGRRTDIPWANLKTLTVVLSQAEPLAASDVKVTGLTVANYGPVTVTPVSGSTTYLITLARPIAAADRVTVTIGNAGITTYTRRLDVLPGDVDDDGLVSSSDATLASGYLLSTYVMADIVGDGVVSTKSVKAIQLLNGTTLPLLG